MFAKHAGDLTNDKYVFAKFDTDALADLAKELDIRSIPAFFIFKNGDKVDTLAGANPPALQKLTATYAEKSQSEVGDGVSLSSLQAGENTASSESGRGTKL